jgi:hypothetical protein
MRHRLSRAGNRRLNHVLYMAGIVQLRNDTAGRSSYRHLLAGGKTRMEAMRCVRRHRADVAWRQLAGDAARKHAGSAFASPRRLPDVCMRSRCTGLMTPYGGLGPFELLRPWRQGVPLHGFMSTTGSGVSTRACRRVAAGSAGARRGA